MTETDQTKSRLDRVVGAAGPRVTEAFSALGNETRLSILLALWEEYEPFAEVNAVPFSELRERVGVRDSGQFSYHLDKLSGQFIKKSDDGYELRRVGLQLVRAVIAGMGFEEPALEQTEINDECTLCGAPTAVSYQDEMLYHVCTECEGYFGSGGDRPDGTLAVSELDPAGLWNRHPEEIVHAAATMSYQTFESAIEGVCTVCSGPMDRSLDICSTHSSEGVCDKCGRRPAVIVRFHCPVCKIHHQAPPYVLISQHPAVIAFYYKHGVPLQYEVDDFESERRRRHLYKSHDQTLVAENPTRIRVQIEYEGATLRLMLDEDLHVIESDESV